MRAWEDVQDEPLQFVVRGKTYVVDSPPLELGIILQTSGDENAKLKEMSAYDLWELAIGPDTYGQLRADGAPTAAVARIGEAAITWARTNSRVTAIAVWESNLDPEALPAPAAGDGPETPPSTPPAAESTTPLPGSGTNTTKTKPKTGTPSSGETSSTNGTT